LTSLGEERGMAKTTTRRHLHLRRPTSQARQGGQFHSGRIGGHEPFHYR
jgi:hypothetical protein